MPTTFLPSPDVELEDWGPLEEATGPQMDTSGHQHLGGRQGRRLRRLGVHARDPSHWTLETNEFIYVVSGRMTVTPDGGEPLELGPGNSAVFPVGWTGTWDIHETLRKLYVIY